MDLLKSAIAEAKAVKSIANKNAVATLTEAFAPQMQSLLSKRIAEDELEDDELNLPIDEVEEDETDKSMEPQPTPEEDATPADPEPVEDEDDELDIDEVLAELEGEDEMEEEPMVEVEDEMEEEPIDDESIDEILREVEDELSAEDDSSDDMKAENIQLKKKLKEAYKVISSQKNVLNEVGVLNAKLLYTTKILGKYDLTENQKLKVLEALDRAKNLRETKLVYATIVESLSKKSTQPKRKIVEGSSSKSIRSISKPIVESSSKEGVINKERWKQLAGI